MKTCIHTFFIKMFLTKINLFYFKNSIFINSYYFFAFTETPPAAKSSMWFLTMLCIYTQMCPQQQAERILIIWTGLAYSKTNPPSGPPWCQFLSGWSQRG